MAVLPKFKLYDSTGLNLLYEFLVVQRTNAPQSPLRHLSIEGNRGTGALIIEAGTPAWELEIEGIFVIDNASEGYEEITVKIDAIESAIALNTPYILRLDKTDATTYEYKVKRLNPIDYPTSLRNDSQEYRVVFLVGSW